MKGRIGKYKDKIVVWGDPNLTAKNEINIDSLERGGEESQTGDSDSMNYYILKEDLDFSLSSKDFRDEVYNKTKGKTLRALMNITDESVLFERIGKSFLDVKLINAKGAEEDPLMKVFEVYYMPFHEIIVLFTDEASIDSVKISNNNRYIYVGYENNHTVIGGNFAASNGRINGILRFSTPKVVQLCNGSSGTYLTGQLINPIEALCDEEILNTWFKKVSFAEYNEFTKKVLLKAFG